MTDERADLPLSWDTTDAPSAFDAADWFDYCEQINGRPPPVLPAPAIQTVIPAHFDLVVERYGATVDDFTLADHPLALFEHQGLPMAIGRSATGGMSQRVALVRAIVNEPQVLLLDEPLAALDLQLRKRMQIELRAIQQRIGTTFIHVTHDQEEALVLSDRVILMQAGRIVQVGTPQEVYRRPKTRFVAEFVGDTSLVACKVKRPIGRTVEVVFASGASRVIDFHGDGGVEPGASGLVSLRPQHLRLVRPGAGAFAGQVTEIVFTGASTDYIVAIEGGSARVRGADDSPRTRGEAVGIEIEPGGGVFVLTDEGGAAAA